MESQCECLESELPHPISRFLRRLRVPLFRWIRMLVAMIDRVAGGLNQLRPNTRKIRQDEFFDPTGSPKARLASWRPGHGWRSTLSPSPKARPMSTPLPALSTFGHEIRSSIEEATELDDADTADLFTEVSRGVDKWLWFVESHYQASKVWRRG